jgi:hypothetical protein
MAKAPSGSSSSCPTSTQLPLPLALTPNTVPTAQADT